MGFTYVKITLCNPMDRTKRKQVELLVDTGAVYPVVSRKILEEIEIKPEGRRRFSTIDKHELEREVGIAIIEYDERSTGALLIFGEEQDEQVLGVYALEGLGLEIDPVTKELRPMKLLLI